MTRPGRFQCARCSEDDMSAKEAAEHVCPRRLPEAIEALVRANTADAITRSAIRAELRGLVPAWGLEPLEAARLLEDEAGRIRSDYEAQKRPKARPPGEP